MTDFPVKILEAIRPEMEAEDLAKSTTMATLIIISKKPSELMRRFGNDAQRVARLIDRAIQIKSNNVPKRTR